MSAILAPTRSRDQRMVALQKANRIRVDRAQMKRHVKAGLVTAKGILRSARSTPTR